MHFALSPGLPRQKLPNLMIKVFALGVCLLEAKLVKLGKLARLGKNSKMWPIFMT